MKQLVSSFWDCFHPAPLLVMNCNGEDDKEVEEQDVRSQTIRSPNLRVFTYDELKAATRGFKNKIGQGGFGSVYKVIININNDIEYYYRFPVLYVVNPQSQLCENLQGRLIGDKYVAVKVLSVEVESMRGEREFVSEIAALSDLRHENLVTLKGCCVGGAQRLLVYDYMENNSLNHTFLGSEKNRVKFTWELRKRVTLGTAEGLCYLHEVINPHIVHRDIKGSNILLDQNFTPKLADFGLARLFRDDLSHISTRVAGTLGYLSPEYAHSGRLTRKSDVYSFGVLLLEIVSGHPVVDYHMQHGEQYLVDKAWELHNAKNLVELVDSVLNGDFPEKEVVRFLKVGLLCVQETTRLRPAMSTAIKMLKNETDTENIEISRPGRIVDLMDVKIQQKHLSHSSSSSSASISTGSFPAR
ncbi:putative serine/threonine-protein kinase isoform X1 [Primulina tabacum]|uniref:putative serine/threonine-protein kinase isoform X1 n=1 Tax=Primulina tabacum TaxID=48773 RepID=UPI003F5A1E1B